VKSYFSHGKVLLAGEYAVLSGVEALALPVRAGQWQHVWEMPAKGVSKLVWQSKEADGSVWFECRVDTDIMHISETNNQAYADTLLRLLMHIKDQKAELFLHKNIRIETECEFERSFGLGSSSTLVCNLAKWSDVDAQELQQRVFGGSGYDVAVGNLGRPLVYWLENNESNWSAWQLPADFTHNWYLAFPGEKQNSRESLSSVKTQLEKMSSDIALLQQMNACIQAIKTPRSLPMLEAMLEMWQALLSQRLDLPRPYEMLGVSPVKGGLCKYLGAWGGDVLLINLTFLQANETAFENMELVPWNEFVIPI
jgi:mevalonate kinase